LFVAFRVLKQNQPEQKNMGDRGVFAVHRGLFGHPFFKREPLTEREAWTWMIGEAAWKATRVRINRATFSVERGQLVHAMRYLASRWQWSEPRVRRFLARLKREGMIDTLAHADATLITICKYDDYQFGTRLPDAPGDEPATHSRRREEKPENLEVGVDASAHATSSGLISQEALDLATELAIIAGHNPEFLPPKWVGDGPAYRVQMMLDLGWRAEIMRENAKAAMRKKRDGPPTTIKYFEPIFAKAHAPQLPLPSVQVVSNQEASNGKAAEYNPADWRSRHDQRHSAKAKLNAFVQACTNPAGDSGGPVSE
jgi:hypothetical protein